MNKSLIIMVVASFLSSSLYASVVKGLDTQNSCDLYRVIKPDTILKKTTNEEVIFAKEVYGLSIQDLEINFDNREVSVQPKINVLLGLNRNLTEDKMIISSNHENFNFLINQINRKIYLFEKICIKDGKLVYASGFPEETQPLKN